MEKMIPQERLIPRLVTHCRWCAWYRRQCPECKEMFRNGGARAALGYPLHYAAEHLKITAPGKTLRLP